jgi:sugar/nucleoside kinase (ribokinase family)
MNKTAKIGVFVGISTIDIVYGVDRFPAPNSKVSAHSQNVFIGGPATNAAVTFQHLGGAATLVTVAGRHPLSNLIRGESQQHGIALFDLKPEFDEVPVISCISVNPAGERNIVSANAHGVRVPEVTVDKTVLGDAAVLLIDGHYMTAAQAWASAARGRRIEVVLDGGSWKDGTEKLLENVTTAICSADFSPPGCSTEDEVFHYLKDHGVKNIAITRGAEPIRFVAGDRTGLIPVPQIESVDSMGAGDIFHGSFCYYFASAPSFEGALSRASAIAAESCRYRGTREWMRHIPNEK